MGSIRMGVDLALKQTGDYTAIMVVEEVDGVEDEFDARLYERLPRGTSLFAIIARVIEIRDNIKAIQDQRDKDAGKEPDEIDNYGPDEILVDQSGLGDPIVEEMRARGLEVTGVNLTGGNTITEEYVSGGRHISIPKTALISRLSALAGIIVEEDGSKHSRLHLDSRSPYATDMMEELRGFRMKVTPSANLQFEPFKTGGYDDLIVAAGLACWRRVGSMFIGVESAMWL